MVLNKCIEFDLPSGSGGMAAGMTRHAIGKQIHELSKKHNFIYKSKVKGYKFKIWLEHEWAYSLVILVWEPPNIFGKPKIVHETFLENDR